ncbi:MAG TPA: response regulator transcription factor [Acidobacteriaceae bacterium]|nr:response regulator transcription factor [Acidobacteriaceae bacterium]
MTQRIRVVLAEDQGMLRGALATLLSIEPDMEVLGSFCDGEEALHAVGRQRPDVLVADIEMPKMSGLELTARVRELYPATRVLILTTFARPGYLRRALDAGASGYLLKDRPSEELAEAVREVSRGGRVVDPELASQIWSAEKDPLTDRERVILRRAGDGETTAELARSLRLTEGTVRNYLSEAISKLQAANRFEAARIARNKGWL